MRSASTSKTYRTIYLLLQVFTYYLLFCFFPFSIFVDISGSVGEMASFAAVNNATDGHNQSNVLNPVVAFCPTCHSGLVLRQKRSALRPLTTSSNISNNPGLVLMLSYSCMITSKSVFTYHTSYILFCFNKDTPPYMLMCSKSYYIILDTKVTTFSSVNGLCVRKN
ncbi:unnamed protein product [Schistosoma curassoni]|uniref:LITAF domain-containing protein n=1 Tax=Schistosoma curassoni TaxID=6186 RepID=A0A183JSF1_9TREM|nr:unnamed protein product [Schistosoma curassoni]